MGRQHNSRSLGAVIRRTAGDVLLISYTHLAQSELPKHALIMSFTWLSCLAEAHSQSGLFSSMHCPLTLTTAAALQVCATMPKREFVRDATFLVGLTAGILTLLVATPAVVKDLAGVPDDNYVARGAYGDQFASVNALFSGLAMVLVVFNLMQQRRELLDQRQWQATSELVGDWHKQTMLRTRRTANAALLALSQRPNAQRSLGMFEDPNAPLPQVDPLPRGTPSRFWLFSNSFVCAQLWPRTGT